MAMAAAARPRVAGSLIHIFDRPPLSLQLAKLRLFSCSCSCSRSCSLPNQSRASWYGGSSETTSSGSFRWPSHPSSRRGISPAQIVARGSANCLQISSQQRQRTPVQFGEAAVARAAAEGFDAEAARTAEEVGHGRAAQDGVEHAEERDLHAVRDGPRALPLGRKQFSTFEFSSNDSHNVSNGSFCKVF